MTKNSSKLNIDLIITRIKEIKVGLEKIRNYVKIDVNDFLQNEERIAAIKYELIVVIEAASILCNHITMRVGNRVPDTYSDCYTVLEESKVITADIANRLKKMAQFRNLLVHRYHIIDDRRVYNTIKRDLNDLDLFVSEIKAFLEKQEVV